MSGGKMIVCKGCGAEIYKGVKKCPQCGKKNKKPTGFIILAVIIVVVIIALISRPKEEKENKKTEYLWPTTGIATLLPQPESKYGEISLESEDYFSIDIYSVSPSDFDSYVASCKEEGFTVDYNGSSSSYMANDAEGNSLLLYYDEDEKKMSISIRKEEEVPEEEEAAGDEEVSEDTSSPDEDNETGAESEDPSNDDITAADDVEFRAWVDSYEKFMNEYVEFMKKYMESDGTDLSLAADYATYVSEYAEFMEASENVNADSLSVEDYQYYLDANKRVLEKLSEIQ